MDRSREVLEFWFEGAGDGGAIDAQHPCYRRWFSRAPAVDRHIQNHFSSLIEAARAGRCDDWLDTPRATLALVLVLDQFPRHVFRDDARAFASDARALAISSDCIARHSDESLALIERVFLYLPLQHSERLSDHALALERFEALAQAAHDRRAAVAGFCRAAVGNEREHIDTLALFGRYPYRNAALGRRSTSEELAWLRRKGRLPEPAAQGA